jgi:hypothetical protein
MALCAGGSAPNITTFHFRESVALVSGQCGVPQWLGSTKLSRGVGGQRGHAGQVLVSALWRRYGLGSLADRAGSAVDCGSAWSPCSWQLWRTPATAVGASRSLARPARRRPRALVVVFCDMFSSWSRKESGGYRPKRPVSQAGQRPPVLSFRPLGWVGLVAILLRQ